MRTGHRAPAFFMKEQKVTHIRLGVCANACDQSRINAASGEFPNDLLSRRPKVTLATRGADAGFANLAIYHNLPESPLGYDHKRP